MSILGDRPHNAPDSPEFYALSQAMLRLDGLNEDFDLHTMEGYSAATERILDGLIDKEDVWYAAQQRAFRSVGAQTVADIERHRDRIALAIAAWLDGFAVALGAIDRLRALKEDGGEEDAPE